MQKHWIKPKPVHVPAEFQSAVGGHPLVAELLWRRGIHDVTRARQFIEARLYTPASPDELPNMTKAVDRIVQAIEGHERVGVWGDFDVDGQTATALLISALQQAGLSAVYYIPDRETEGHGIRAERLHQWTSQQGLSLVITCDTGIAAHEAINTANQHGGDVIVTDHHQLPESLPDALACVNPQMLPEGHPLRTLAGVGVAYKVIESLFESLRFAPDACNRYLDLVALGLIADVALLVDDARYLVQCGLDVLRWTQRPGLQAVYAIAEVDPNALDERDVAFSLAPRLNALGRLGDANLGVELLITKDVARARLLANQLEGLNNQRRMLTRQVYAAADSLIQRDSSLLDYNALVVAHPHWPGGIIGIVANQLAETYQRPVVMLSLIDDMGRGSARSVEGVDITAALNEQRHLLRGFGGHTMAAGLTIDAGRIGELRRGLSHTIGKMRAFDPTPEIVLDAYVSLNDLDLDFVHDLRRLAPFGAGNPAPVLAVENVSVLKRRSVGRTGDHAAFMIEDQANAQREVMWWNSGDEELPAGTIDLAFSARENRYKGEVRLQLEYIDALLREEAAPNVASRRQVIDYRHAPDALVQLLKTQTDSAMFWNEAQAVAGITAKRRHELARASTLVIWSAPPSYDVLQGAIAQVQPMQIYVGAAYNRTQPDEVLEKIAGMAKYALKNHAGQIDIERAAGALAVTPALIRLGIQYWGQRGSIRVVNKQNTMWQLESGGEAKSVDEARAILAQVAQIVQEINAFRGYFASAKLDTLFL